MNPAHQAIAMSVKYICPSNKRGSRVKVSCKRLALNKTFSYDYSARGAYEQIENALFSAGIPCESVLDMGKSYILTVNWSHRESVQKFLGK